MDFLFYEAQFSTNLYLRATIIMMSVLFPESRKSNIVKRL